ncbi:MAG: NAD(+) diphosphatase [Polyangiales bacterium]
MASDDSPRTLDRAAALRKDLDQLEAALRAPDTLLVPVHRDLSLVSGDQLALLPLSQAQSLLETEGELVFLGTLAGRACFALDVSALADPLQHGALAGRGELRDLRMVGATLSPDHAGLAAYARGIMHWHKRHQHCGVCGSKTAARQGGHVRVCRNESCRTEHFPRTDPAIIVLVEHDGRCLLGRQRNWPAGMYSVLAGFVEPGESMEQAVVREVAEEAGVAVDDVRYFRSQPWPFPSSLMIGFTARALAPEIALADQELEDARWVSRAEIRDCRAHGFFVPGSFSLSGQLIEAFLAQEP